LQKACSTISVLQNCKRLGPIHFAELQVNGAFQFCSGAGQ
jgi:hypothetical protein